MAFAKGRQAAEETAKAECLRRWPGLRLKCKAVYYNGHREGFVIERLTDGRMIAGERSASEAWRTTLARLEDNAQATVIH